MNDERSFRCPSCRGVVGIPERRRTIDIETVREVHRRSCPQRGMVYRDEPEGGEDGTEEAG